jgi:hypothetical protein
MTALTRQKKITFGEMREAGVDRVLIYCADYNCSHSRGERSIAALQVERLRVQLGKQWNELIL